MRELSGAQSCRPEDDHMKIVGDPEQYGTRIMVRSLVAAGSGGAKCRYDVVNFNQAPADRTIECRLQFQEGPIDGIFGVNGITNESLLAIVEDRLADFQRGPFPCKDNEFALFCVRHALSALADRRSDRRERGVLGKCVE